MDFRLPNHVEVDGISINAKKFPRLAEKGLDFDENQLNKDEDVLIASYPRTGTTWLSQIVSLLQADDDNYERVNNTEMNDRVIFMEVKRDPNWDSIEKLKNQQPPRTIKTHLPYRFVNQWVERDGVKTVVTRRNPKDTLVSYYNFYRMSEAMGPFSGTWNDFFAHIQAGKLLYGDQADWNDGWLKHKDNPNILFINYEEMLQDQLKEMKRIVAFLDLNVTEEKYNRVLKDSNFSSMQTNPSTNRKKSANFNQSKAKFIRSGKGGDWKQYFTVDQNEWFDEKYKKRYEDAGLYYYTA